MVEITPRLEGMMPFAVSHGYFVRGCLSCNNVAYHSAAANVDYAGLCSLRFQVGGSRQRRGSTGRYGTTHAQPPTWNKSNDMGFFFSSLFKRTPPLPTESFQELMHKYRQVHNDPREQRLILAKAAAVAEASGDLMQQMEVVTTLNQWEQRHGR